MNAIIIGGTGFIGYHTAQRLLSEGYNVTITSRNAPPEGVFAAAIRWQKLDITACSDAELCALLRDNPYIVFAASADDRTLATAPAADFFARRNVQTVAQIVRCAEQKNRRQARLPKCGHRRLQIGRASCRERV